MATKEPPTSWGVKGGFFLQREEESVGGEMLGRTVAPPPPPPPPPPLPSLLRPCQCPGGAIRTDNPSWIPARVFYIQNAAAGVSNVMMKSGSHSFKRLQHSRMMNSIGSASSCLHGHGYCGCRTWFTSCLRSSGEVPDQSGGNPGDTLSP